MSAKNCAKCAKVAYPLESLVAGDDTYHKLCFKCSGCQIVLNLKTFKKHSGEIWCTNCTPKEKHTQVTDSVLTQRALSAPKVSSGFISAHKGDKSTEPKMAEFGNDRQIQSGEFESEAAPSSADTGIRGGAVLQAQSGEFESTPEQSSADTGIRGGAVLQAQSGEFESNPKASYADTHS